MSSPYKSRLERLSKLVAEENACAALVINEYNSFYFTGFRGPLTLVVKNSHTYGLIPPLEYLRAKHVLGEEGTPVELLVYYPYGLPGGLALDIGSEPLMFRGGIVEAVKKILGSDCNRVLVDTVYNPIAAKLAESGLECVDVGKKIREWRMVKEQWELERIEVAVRIAETALTALLREIEIGASEAELAGLLEREMMASGAEDRAFPPIVAFGRNTVYPHHVPTQRRLVYNEPVLVDLGAVYKGYNSDMTRTFWYGDSVDRDFVRVLEAVSSAVDSAIDALQPGVVLEEVDLAARRELAKHGLDRYFNHSLGHGVGVAIHEEPRISPGNKTKAVEGMVVTIEPGVYIPGKYGVRIEELVVVGKRRAKSLTRLPRLISVHAF